MDKEILSSLARRFHVGKAGDSEAERFLRECWYWLYSSFPEHRCDIRLVLGGSLIDFRAKPSRTTRISPILDVLGQIIRGFQVPLLDIHRDLLVHVLLPLHEPNQMAEWRDQLPLITEYHDSLVYAIVQMLDKEPSLAPEAIRTVLRFWPKGFQSNSAKEVLLLHELETLIRYLPPDSFEFLAPLIVSQVANCLSTENSRIVERALFMWQDDHFLGLIEEQIKAVMKPIISVLYRDGKPFWNPTVNKMTAAVLERMEKMDQVLFAQVSEEIMREQKFSSGKAVDHKGLESGSVSNVVPSSQSYDTVSRISHVSADTTPNTTRLMEDAGSSSTSLSAPKMGSISSVLQTASANPPPLTITGVAPWAFSQTARHPMYSTRKQNKTNRIRNTKEDNSTYKKHAKVGMSDEVQRNEDTKQLPPHNEGTTTGSAIRDSSEYSIQKESITPRGEASNGIKEMKAYIEKLKPAADSCDGNVEGSWHAEQMGLSPTRYPDLKFHNLVFGRELGCGSFSRVRYARQIKRELPRSKWPEFAVKIMDMEQFEANNYKVNVSTEIAILSALNHPGIARLVSSFQWKGGAYLVLEYGERGDLQMLIAQYGSLNEDSTRWVVGEIVGAICYVHSSGFVYSDLKPENVLITHSGHIKLTDFGAARPITQQGRDTLYSSYRTLNKLRNGDWRPMLESAGVNNDDGEEDERRACEELLQRVEGTAAYLPPEVARSGSRPGFPTDAWALGCLMLQCFSGRPPVLGDVSGDDYVTLSNVVRFVKDEEQGLRKALSYIPEEVSLPARCLVTSLLNPEPSHGKRITIEDSANHKWFTDANLNVHGMNADPSPVQLLAGPVGPQTNAVWNRRQNSMIWAPMPEPFELQGEKRSALGVIDEKEVERCGSFVKRFAALPEFAPPKPIL